MNSGPVCAQTTPGIVDATQVGANGRQIDARRGIEPARVHSQRRNRAGRQAPIQGNRPLGAVPAGIDGRGPDGTTGAGEFSPTPCAGSAGDVHAGRRAHARRKGLRYPRQRRLKLPGDENNPPVSARGQGTLRDRDRPRRQAPARGIRGSRPAAVPGAGPGDRHV